MYKYKITYLCLLIALLFGCGSGNSPINIPTSDALVTPSVTLIASETTQPRNLTPTILVNTPTMIPTQIVVDNIPTVTSSPAPHLSLVKTDCLELIQPSEQIKISDGQIFLLGQNDGVSSYLFESGRVTVLEGDYAFSLGAEAPDKKWLAYYDYGASKLMLLDGNGDMYDIVDWDDQWHRVLSWLDRDKLVIQQKGEMTGNSIPPVGIYSLNDHSYLELTRDYPNQYFPAEWEYLWTSSTIYDPDLTMVIYPAFPTDSQVLSLNLVDLQTGQVIAEIGGYRGGIISTPKWSPNGDRLATPIERGLPQDYTATVYHHQEFIISDRYGNYEQVTNFNDYFEEPRIGHFNWSPDGQRIAFWFQNWPESHDEFLMVLDISTRQVVNYCIASDPRDGPSAPPIWSPDGNSLIARVIGYENGEEEDNIVLIDLKNAYAVTIAQNLRPIGWLISPEE